MNREQPILRERMPVAVSAFLLRDLVVLLRSFKMEMDLIGALPEIEIRRAGYIEVPAFNDEPYAHHWFEKQIQGEAKATGAD